MGFRGPFSVPPGNGRSRTRRSFGDAGCHRCKGRGYIAMTAREVKQRKEIDALTDFVFGALPPQEGFPNPGWYSLPDGDFNYCPECQALHAAPAERTAELRALRVLARRTERGETFDSQWRHDPEGALRENPTAKTRKAVRTKSVSRKPKTSKQSLSEQLAQLAELREAGALTATEFKLAKQRLLNSPKAPTRAPTKRKTQRKWIAPPQEGFGGPGRYL